MRFNISKGGYEGIEQIFFARKELHIMKRILSFALALALLVGCAAALSGCSSKEENGPQFHVYLGEEVYDFDPGDYYVSADAEQIMSLLYEPLFDLSENGKLQLAAAKNYIVDEKERTITITIRESYWSNGTRLLAQDFVFAWTRILNPDISNPAAALFYDIEGALDVKNNDASGGIYNESLGIKAESAYNIKITYREGADYKQILKNLASVATSPINRSAYEQDPAKWSKNLSTMVFNGPFTITALNYTEGVFRLTKNAGYHQDPTEAKPMKYVTPHVIFSNFNKALTYEDIENKTIFYMGDASLAERAEYANKAESADLLSTYSYLFNTKTNDFLKNKDVRKALTIAIDRNEIVEAVTFGKAAAGLIPDACDDFRETAILTSEANITKAKELLSGVSGIGAMDTAITLTVNDDEQSVKIAELVAARWESLGNGISVTVNAVNFKTSKSENVNYYDSEIQQIIKEASEGNIDFDVIGIDLAMYSEDPFVALAGFSSNYATNGFKVDASNNTIVREHVTGWTSEGYDALIDAAYKATDSDTRTAKLREAEALLLEECPVAPIIYNQNFAFVGSKLKNVEIDGFGHFVFKEANLKNYEAYLPKEEDGGESEE